MWPVVVLGVDLDAAGVVALWNLVAPCAHEAKVVLGLRPQMGGIVRPGRRGGWCWLLPAVSAPGAVAVLRLRWHGDVDCWAGLLVPRLGGGPWAVHLAVMTRRHDATRERGGLVEEMMLKRLASDTR